MYAIFIEEHLNMYWKHLFHLILHIFKGHKSCYCENLIDSGVSSSLTYIHVLFIQKEPGHTIKS